MQVSDGVIAVKCDRPLAPEEETIFRGIVGDLAKLVPLEISVEHIGAPAYAEVPFGERAPRGA